MKDNLGLLIVFLASAFVAACGEDDGTGSNSAGSALIEGCIDEDGDEAYVCTAGFDSGDARIDCDDSTARTQPGADEACNGIDDDCDGAVDEAITGCESGGDGTPHDESDDAPDDCVDADGDGAYVCETSSWSRIDCDDSTARTQPGADEACNGIDDDCDGAVDEGITGCES